MGVESGWAAIPVIDPPVSTLASMNTTKYHILAPFFAMLQSITHTGSGF
jgi:hypothetical protein